MTNSEKIEKGCSLLLDGLAGALSDAMKTLTSALNNAVKIVINKKITKKKFIKLLQSKGIQKNEINKMIQNNTEPYTMARFMKIINERR